MLFLASLSLGNLGDKCTSSDQCDFSQMLICQTVDATPTYETCVRHCYNDFECNATQFCSCSSSLDSTSDSNRDQCAQAHTQEYAFAYCKNNADASTSASKCFTYRQLTESLTGKVCGKSGSTTNAGANCGTYATYGIHMKGCKCAPNYENFFTCKECSNVSTCASCINGYELGQDGDCHAICRDGINFVNCACGAKKAPCAAGKRCNLELSTVCEVAGCLDCAANYSECTLCSDGFKPSGKSCAKLCSETVTTDCLCGTGSNEQKCPVDKPQCDVIRGVCSLQCAKSISSNCQYCDENENTCTSCKSGYYCIKDGVLTNENCTTECQKRCTAQDHENCICQSDSESFEEFSAECGGSGNSCFGNKCIGCANNCRSCYVYDIIEGFQRCKKCVNGYGFSTLEKLACTPLCSDEVISNCSCGGKQTCTGGKDVFCNDGACIERQQCNAVLAPDCTQCWVSADVCDKCKNGYYCVKDGKYEQEDCESCITKCSTLSCLCIGVGDCNTGLACVGNRCESCMTNCAACSSLEQCDQCKDGYGFKDVQTKIQCISKCSTATRENCSCGSEGQCATDSLCVNDKCQKKQTCNDELLGRCTNCWVDTNVCAKCQEGLYCANASAFLQAECAYCLPKCQAISSKNCVCISTSTCGDKEVCEGNRCLSCPHDCAQCTSTTQCTHCGSGFGCEHDAVSCADCQPLCFGNDTDCLCGPPRARCSGTEKCIDNVCKNKCPDNGKNGCYCDDGLLNKDGVCVKQTNQNTAIITTVVVVVVVLAAIIILLTIRMLKKKKSKANVRSAGFNIRSVDSDEEMEKKLLEEKRKKKLAQQQQKQNSSKAPQRDKAL